MKPRILLSLAAVAAIAAPLAFAPTPAAQASQARDWTKTVVPTVEGGFRMGNPQAPLKIVEYLSLSCPACRAFSATGMPQIMQRVRSGQANIEIRSYVLNPFDAAAALLNRCASPQSYFALNDAILAEQPQWMARFRALTDAQITQLDALQESEQLLRLASIGGLDRIAARHGVTAARARACLTDRNGLMRISQMRQAANELGVSGTPSFLVNGRLARNVHDWASLAPLLQQRR
jgi:protein-disulfide isomerase